MNELHQLRLNIRESHLADEQAVLYALTRANPVSKQERDNIVARATQLVEDIRASDDPGVMEAFLAEYGLSTDEGVALMCLAEALLRVPDAETIDALIEDKIAPSSWGEHLGQSSSSLVNASTWALMLTGKILNDEETEGFAGVLRGAVKRLGEPVIRTAVKQAMKELGSEFVLGRDIEEAIERGKKAKSLGFTYSYDMLGEAALTNADAKKFFAAYQVAIKELAVNCTSDDIRENPGISIKLSALHPRYEVSQRKRVMLELVESTKSLARLAKQAGMGLNIDAEEADRLDLSLDVIEAVLRDPELAGWDGFGVVVQAYSKRCSGVIDWLYVLASKLDRKIMVRLVKGAYWDSEIKLAQQEGTIDFPVFTQKASTDASYISCASKLLGMTDRIYPQFATHNAHTMAAVLELTTDKQAFEFQRLHGMGEQLHLKVLEQEQTRCRIYAPVGAHRDLLAYLVRRLLENGANSSFVNQIVDTDIPASEVASDPFDEISEASLADDVSYVIQKPADLYAPSRTNSKGWDLHSIEDLAEIEAARTSFKTHQWHVGPLIACENPKTSDAKEIVNPAAPYDIVGSVSEATVETVELALNLAQNWSGTPIKARADILRKAADLYESNFGELFAALSREAGKGQIDVISELREAVDFLRYYAAESEGLFETKPQSSGLFACISPWNFPLAIFTGQLSAALAAGNGVLAKPAEQTPITANIAIRLLHEAGVPESVLQLLPGAGSVVGSKLTADPRISGVCFTGSTATAKIINKSIAQHLDPRAPLIAETGGLNAMIVDSTALPEQAVGDIVNSAFQSAGQRCSALRMLYLQEDTADIVLKMLYGAMDELVIAQPWDFDTDIGPVIDQAAKQNIQAHIQVAKDEGRVLKSLPIPETGNFVAPTVIKVSSIADLKEEIFGPVLHIATFAAEDLDEIVDDINAKGYGLTFGLHTRIDDRVESITTRLKVGNMYINRNQIGAVVGSQPFGGEGLSGTGPKAGGPAYVKRFTDAHSLVSAESNSPHINVESALLESTFAGSLAAFEVIQKAIDVLPEARGKPLYVLGLPGPTGESNRLSVYARGVILCLGPTVETALEQATVARGYGCSPLIITADASEIQSDIPAVNGQINLQDLEHIQGIDAVAFWGDESKMRSARQALAARDGAILPLIYDKTDLIERCILERHICIDTTAAGGNASLLAASS